MENMKGLEALEQKVEELEEEKNMKKQVKLLQEINKMLLNDYVIKISDGCVIHPLRVEAYYFDEKKFRDGYCHQSENQKKRFGRLYLHPEKGRSGRPGGGVDICLSLKENYCLSFLIRNSLIDNVFTRQQALYEKLRGLESEGVNLDKRVLFRKEHVNQLVINTARLGLGSKYPEYKEEKLGSLRELWSYPFEKKETIAVEYINDTKTVYRDLLGYVPKSIQQTLHK